MLLRLKIRLHALWKLILPRNMQRLIERLFEYSPPASFKSNPSLAATSPDRKLEHLDQTWSFALCKLAACMSDAAALLHLCKPQGCLHPAATALLPC